MPDERAVKSGAGHRKAVGWLVLGAILVALIACGCDDGAVADGSDDARTPIEDVRANANDASDSAFDLATDSREVVEAGDADDESELPSSVGDLTDLDGETDAVVDLLDTDLALHPVSRIVVAGDSWSTGAALPLIAALPEWGYPDVEVTWETTALAGSQAWEWVANHEGKLHALDAALDREPAAELLLVFIGGNDFNFVMINNDWSQRRRDDTIDDIEDDIDALVEHALLGRPQLSVVLVDYSYFNYPKMRVTYGFDFAPNLHDLNEAYVEMGRRKFLVASRHERCHYAHNFGILQHTLGDEQRVYGVEPYVVPAYEPGFFAAPGHAPNYDPYPGGNTAFPGPDPALFDGLHLTDAAMRVLLDNVRDQGMGNLLDGLDWPH